MRDFLVFCVSVLSAYVDALFDLDLGSYSFGSMLTAIILVNIFISSIVIHFRNTNTSSATAPPPPIRGGNSGGRGGRKG